MTPEATRLMFASTTVERPTPQWLFEELDREFGFVLDAAASISNAKCRFYLTADDDALTVPWVEACPEEQPSIFCNPPYGRGLSKWLAKFRQEADKGATVVTLLPSRTDTKWFHAWVWDPELNQVRPGVELRFIKGRLVFGGCDNAAPFPSLVAIFHPPEEIVSMGVSQSNATSTQEHERPLINESVSTSVRLCAA